MPPQETDRLLREGSSALTDNDGLLPMSTTNRSSERSREVKHPVLSCSVTILLGVAFSFMGYIFYVNAKRTTQSQPLKIPDLPDGPYELFQLQNAHNFLDHYEFYEGEDSVGSAGYNTYVTKEIAKKHNLVEATAAGGFIIRSAAGEDIGGPRQSVRLEGTTRFNSGLFIVQMEHMPAGCGVWPALWLTDEQFWPDHGEIDFIEGVNYQSSVKTALHTNAFCDMYAHVDETTQMTGTWDRATGIPNTFTGVPDVNTSVPADNCWVQAPHQWSNQGCVIESHRPGTLGPELNAAGGAVFVLEWDPRFAIRSWVFVNGVDDLPENLASVLEDKEGKQVTPDPDAWGLPYAYFAIGQNSGCSADHFVDMRLVVNTAFCGTVAGNRFFTDCNVAPPEKHSNPIKACNAYIASEPEEMDEAYWNIDAIRVYQRRSDD